VAECRASVLRKEALADRKERRVRCEKTAPCVRFTGAPTFEYNVSHFSAEDLYAAKHTTDLTRRTETILYIDAAHRGLGTASCGPDTLPAYRLTARQFTWNYSIVRGEDSRDR
jgi:beta-galactosidase